MRWKWKRRSESHAMRSQRVSIFHKRALPCSAALSLPHFFHYHPMSPIASFASTSTYSRIERLYAHMRMCTRAMRCDVEIERGPSNFFLSALPVHSYEYLGNFPHNLPFANVRAKICFSLHFQIGSLVKPMPNNNSLYRSRI